MSIFWGATHAAVLGGGVSPTRRAASPVALRCRDLRALSALIPSPIPSASHGLSAALSQCTKRAAEVLTGLPLGVGEELRRDQFETYGLIEPPSSVAARFAVLEEVFS